MPYCITARIHSVSCRLAILHGHLMPIRCWLASAHSLCSSFESGRPIGPPTLKRLVAVRFILGSRDPVERLVRNAVLSEEEAQLGSMFLHVAHGAQLEF